jgi:hypothetical protein
MNFRDSKSAIIGKAGGLRKAPRKGRHRNHALLVVADLKRIPADGCIYITVVELFRTLFMGNNFLTVILETDVLDITVL